MARFHNAMARFHNAIVKWLGKDCQDSFETANRRTRWHFQWIVLEDFLPTVCDAAVVEEVRDGREHSVILNSEPDFAHLYITSIRER